MSVQAPVIDESQPPAPAVAPAAQAWPGRASAWWCVTMLSVVLMLSQIDRNIITLLVAPIKKDLHLSDVQVSLLMGPAFIVLYIFMGLPLSRLTDTKSRRVMITIGLTFWSLATAACGLAQSFWQLFAARVGLGAGESVNGPATYSLLADNFPRERLPRALAVLNIGFVLGGAFSLIAGGLIIGLLTSRPTFDLPLVGPMRGWQMVFIVVGLPGLIAAALMMTVAEPARRGLAGQKPVALPVREVVRYLVENRDIYGSMIGGVAISALLTAGIQGWGPTFYQRTFGWSPRQVGLASGTMALIASPIGLFLGAALTEWLGKRHDDANLRVSLLAYILALPFQIAGPLMPTPWLSLGCSGIGVVCALMASTPYVAALQTVTPNQMRAQISAFYLFVFSGVGGGLGALLFGAITDFIVRDENNIRYTMSGAAAIMAPLAVLIISRARKPYGRAVAAIKAAEAAAQAPSSGPG